jgi:hypothetical protein
MMFVSTLVLLGFLVSFIACTYDRDPDDGPTGSRSRQQSKAKSKAKSQGATGMSAGNRAGLYTNYRNVH